MKCPVLSLLAMALISAFSARAEEAAILPTVAEQFNQAMDRVGDTKFNEALAGTVNFVSKRPTASENRARPSAA